jgi:hypothetical protein
LISVRCFQLSDGIVLHRRDEHSESVASEPGLSAVIAPIDSAR